MVEQRLNHLGQPIGPELPDWTPPPWPAREAMTGRYCTLEPLDVARHAAPLFEAFAAEPSGAEWTYLPYGPFEDEAAFERWLGAMAPVEDPVFFTICVDGSPVGLASYLRIFPEQGSIEVGHIHYSSRLKRTPAATEAMYLMMRRAFEWGYRRYEWKCDALNAASRAASQRLGFTYEGIFRQATVYKNRSRDTAWFAIIDSEWPALRVAFENWLEPANFDARGQQRSSLSDLTRAALTGPQQE